MNQQELYIGAMSGTSCDGIDVVLIDLTQAPYQVLASFSTTYSRDTQQLLTELAQASQYDLNELYTIDVKIGHYYATAINGLLAELPPAQQKQVQAVGMHGQTIRHCPNAATPFTVQLGCASTVATKTKLPVIADFRRKDLAKGGQGAPLAPLFHQQAFLNHNASIAIINIGGISNISLLSAAGLLTGYDVGPGNVIIDGLANTYFAQAYDDQGKLAATGQVCAPWLMACLADNYFDLLAPKSTGREYFNLDWFEAKKPVEIALDPCDMMATATELTAHTIAKALADADALAQQASAAKLTAVYICGGGANNKLLLQRITALSGYTVASTEVLGVAPQLVEAATFAWLAQQTWRRQPLDLSGLTGSNGGASCLGGIYLP